MAANSSIGEIFATSLENYSSTLADNVLNHNALLAELLRKGNVKPTNGGREIHESLMYAENQTVMWFSGYDVLDTSPNDVIDAASFSWKQLAGTVVFNGLEQLKNKGEHEKFDLVQSRMMVLEKSLQNEAATGVYALGTGNDGKEFGGLRYLVADDPTTGTVGGINRATQTFWRNQYSAAAATSSGNILTRMRSMWLSCIRGTDKPSLIVADSVMYSHYEASLQAIQRVTSADKASAGFEELAYRGGTRVVYDDAAPASHMYFLNTDYIFLRHDPDTKFRSLGERKSVNQDATVIPVAFYGNMTVSNPSLQGVLIAS